MDIRSVLGLRPTDDTAAGLEKEHDALARSVIDTNSRLRKGKRSERVALPAKRVLPNVTGGGLGPSRHNLLGGAMQLPDPRGACSKVEDLEAGIAHATCPLPASTA